MKQNTNIQYKFPIQISNKYCYRQTSIFSYLSNFDKNSLQIMDLQLLKKREHYTYCKTWQSAQNHLKGQQFF